MVTTKLNLSMTEPSVRQIYAKQGDTGRVLDIALDQTPEDGTLRILRPDGVEVTSEAVTGGEVESGSSFESLTEADVTELTVGIEPVQDLNGYDKPWVGGAGKNLLPKGTSRTSSAGLTFTVNIDGSVTITGTASAVDFWAVQFTIPAGTYTLSGCPSGGGGSSYLIDIRNAAGGSGISGIGSDTGRGTTFTITSALTAYLNIRTASGYAYPSSGLTFYPMIRKSGTDATYEPYSNICPITGHDEVRVTDVGKNRALFSNESNPNRSAFDYTTETAQEISGTSTAGGGRFIGRYIVHLKANTNYKAVGSASWGRGVIYIYSDELWGTIVAPNVQMGASFSVSNDGDYVVGAYVGVATVGTTYTLTDFMVIEASETDTSYAPYQGSTYTTSLGQTVYGGTLDMVTGVLTVDKGYYKVTGVSQISGSGSQSGTYPKWVLALNSLPNVDPSYYGQFWDRQDAVICNMGIMVRESISLNTDETTMSVYFHATNMEIRLRPLVSEFPTLEEAKQVYVGAEFVYPVTPTTYQLTAQQIKTLLGTNNVWASSGDIVNIKFTYGGMLSELPSDATEIVGKCYCDVEQNGVSSMPFTLNVKKNERAT